MERLYDEITDLARSRYTFLYLLTWEEDRAIRLLRRVGEKVSREVVVTHTGASPEGVRGGGLSSLELLAWLQEQEQPMLFVLKDFHHDLGEPAVMRTLRNIQPELAEREQAICVISPLLSLPRELEKDIRVVDIPLPDLAEVAKLLATLIKRQGIKIDVELFEKFVKSSLGLTEAEIKRVYTRIALTGNGFSSEDLTLLIQEKKAIIRKSEYLEFHDQTETMEEVGGLDQLKEWLANRSRAFTEKARKYGLPQPKGLFMVGVQGCGKSLTAKAVANLWRIPLLRMDVGGLLQASGSAEEKLGDTIKLAESLSPVVLWVDEIEKAFAGVETGAAEVAGATRAFGGFITWLQEKTRPVFVVATANNVRALPPELLRKGRFDEIFFVDLPNIHERTLIFQIHLRLRGRSPELFDCWALSEAADKFSGAEIEQVVVAALFSAFAAGREVTNDDLLAVTRESVPLAVTMDQRIKELREWARDRTRPATYDTRRIDFFDQDEDNFSS